MNRIDRYLLSAAAATCAVGIYVAAAPDSAVAAPPAPEAAPASAPPAARFAGPMARDGNPFALGAPPADGDAAAENPEAAGVLGRNGRAVDFGGLSAAQFIAKWSAAARAGNAEAAYQIYQAESVCANNDEPLADYENDSERAAFLRERASAQKICAGVSPAQVQERLHFLALAARAGVTAAQIDFFTEGPYGRSLHPGSNGADPLVQQWNKDALANLQAAAAGGEPFALALLADVYNNGQLLPRNAKMALAYTVADATARHVAWSQTQLRRRFGTQISDADFQDALQTGAQMGRECCQK
ncbi:hypothetical protein [Janthinobacterium fluminis]|uniref:Sel1 repeat family protein n=1 Tax=Janthinobacterium fluminis TaxID=2987524 RepID=A0ABT5JUC6_9BURK|nr:hypothetical protein [Janthinobacterium fluminis]MDC8756015.1 hypothetical protein [Janthinobacterium fluminis]